MDLLDPETSSTLGNSSLGNSSLNDSQLAAEVIYAVKVSNHFASLPVEPASSALGNLPDLSALDHVLSLCIEKAASLPTIIRVNPPGNCLSSSPLSPVNLFHSCSSRQRTRL